MDLRFSTFVFFISFLYFLSSLQRSASLSTIGITYSALNTTNTPVPESIATAVDSLKFGSLRLEDSDPAIIRAFAYTNISLLLTVPNSLVPSIASNRSNALHWLYLHVVPFYPRARITTISVGNDLIGFYPEFRAYLVPAIRNIHSTLRDLGIRKISVSSSFSFVSVITSPFPPSAAQFHEPDGQPVIGPLLQFLKDTNSSFLINVYPYNLYVLNPEIPIGLALFQEHAFNFRDDLTTGVRYRNLFDMMIDAVITAIAMEGHENIPIVVTETGWPTSGSSDSEVDANMAYAELYVKGLVGHLKSVVGTPLRREGVAGAYIYELIDKETGHEGLPPGRNWGVMYPNMTKKYKIDFSGSTRMGGSEGLMTMGPRIFLVMAISLSL